MLGIRSLDAFDSAVLSETEDAWGPFWSPDSRSVGFFVGSQLKKVAISGGRPEVICDFGGVRTTESSSDPAATWSPDGTIVFAGADATLMKVSSNGGKVEPATPASLVAGTNHAGPQFLPDGRHFLFGVATQGQAEGPLYVGSIGGEAPQLIRESVSRALYVEPGFLCTCGKERCSPRNSTGGDGPSRRLRCRSRGTSPLANACKRRSLHPTLE